MKSNYEVKIQTWDDLINTLTTSSLGITSNLCSHLSYGFRTLVSGEG
jgi:hypothetical protein